MLIADSHLFVANQRDQVFCRRQRRCVTFIKDTVGQGPFVVVQVDDAYATCALIKERGGKVTREAGPMKHGTTVIAFVEDPDGYKIELIQTGTL